MKDVQAQMQTLLDALVEEGREGGMQLAAYLNGELVVDVWAGLADADSGQPVDGDTLFPVYSVTKGITATLLHQLVERGTLTYDTRIAEVWPEFAVHGKSEIRVRHALNHTAGLPFFPLGLDYATATDWDTVCAAIARERPVTPPGTCMEYHALTYGWLVGEVLRRVDGRQVAQLLRDEISAPLGVANALFMGIPDVVEPRIAMLREVLPPGLESLAVDATQPRAVPAWMEPLYPAMNRSDMRRACMPAANGIVNARALARHYAALLPGGIDGIALLPPARVWHATQPQPPTDTPAALSFGLGYQLGGDGAEFGSRRTTFGHNGHGGNTGFADPEYRLAVGFTKNLNSPNGAQVQILRALREALKIPQ